MMSVRQTGEGSTRLPWWTWVATAIILHTGTEVSLLFKYDQGVADYYMPTALSVILIHWWGPRVVLPVMYLNAALSTGLWGIPADRWYQWFLYAIPETLFTFLSWYMVRRMFPIRFWMPETRDVLTFLIAGTLIPIVPEIVLLQSLLVWFGDQPVETFWMYVARNFLGEFTSTFGLALPALYYMSPVVQRMGLVVDNAANIPSPPRFRNKQLAELGLLFVLVIGLVLTIEFEKFWYIYGLVSLYTAIRFGFGPAVLMNFYIFLLTYFVPKVSKALGYDAFFSYADVMDIFLGASLLFVFAAVTGRVISDIKIAELNLFRKNRELDLTNRELDRFVYSVSHDLSAPLKSILGLVNISRLSRDPSEQILYLSRIESSVMKLENFISEVLDYSKNKRQNVVAEQIQLRDLCREILENLQYMDGFHAVRIDLDSISEDSIVQDKMRVKIILNNLLTNAVKFQKRIPGHQPYIRISSKKTSGGVEIDVEDNGEGIRKELVGKIFDMFYRGTENANGSGLGLYIAREAARRIQGHISVSSEYGKGSRFTIELQNLNEN